MKTLNVHVLHSGINHTLRELRHLDSALKPVKAAIKNIISLDDALKGQTGQAIRSFFLECHMPFLLLLERVIQEYETVLKQCQNALHDLEPMDRGFIRQAFLEQDVERGLRNLEDWAEDITHEVNQTIAAVSDIIALSKLKNDRLLISIDDGRRKSKQTIDALQSFDFEQTRALESIERDLDTLMNYLQQVESMVRSDNLDMTTYSAKQLGQDETYQQLIASLEEKLDVQPAHNQSPFDLLGGNRDRPSFGPFSEDYLKARWEAAAFLARITSKKLSQEEFEALGANLVDTIQVPDEIGNRGGYFHIYDNGLLVREYYDENFGRKYEMVDKIPPNRAGGVKELDLAFEDTPLVPLEFLGPGGLVGGLVRKGSMKLTKHAVEDAAVRYTKGSRNAFQWTGKNFSQMGKNMSPNEMISNFEKSGWNKTVEPGGKKSGPATILTDPSTGTRVRIHAEPWEGTPYFRVQNKGGGYLDNNGVFPSNATKQELRDATHFYFEK